MIRSEDACSTKFSIMSVSNMNDWRVWKYEYVYTCLNRLLTTPISNTKCFKMLNTEYCISKICDWSLYVKHLTDVLFWTFRQGRTSWYFSDSKASVTLHAGWSKNKRTHPDERRLLLVEYEYVLVTSRLRASTRKTMWAIHKVQTRCMLKGTCTCILYYDSNYCFEYKCK